MMQKKRLYELDKLQTFINNVDNTEYKKERIVIYRPCTVISKLIIELQILQLRYLDYNTRRVDLTFNI